MKVKVFLICCVSLVVVSLALPREAAATVSSNLTRAELSALGCSISGQIDTTYVEVEATDDVWYKLDLWCPPSVADKLVKSGQAALSAGFFESTAVSALNFVLTTFASVGVWLLWLASTIFIATVTISQFVSNPYVASGWPFMLGVANLGFLVALLFIAAMSVLRLNIGGGVRRYLPRLLVAALLINFSLVIGGMLVDFSRVFMAAIASLFGEDFSLLATNILIGSDILTNVFTTASLSQDVFLENKLNPDVGWSTSAATAKAMILIWVLAIGMSVLAVAMMIRYIVLSILLIFSPFAYLLVAIPKAERMAGMWWSQFLKWVFFGPIALFFIVLLTRLRDTPKAPGANAPADFASFLNLFVSVGILIAAVMVGRSAGIAGAGYAFGIASGAGNKLRQYGKAGARGAVKAAYVGTGTRAVTRQTRDAAREFTKPIRRAFRMGEFSKYDKKGKLKKGQETVGSKLGKKASGYAGAVAGAAAGAVLGGPAGAVAGGYAGHKLIGKKDRVEARKKADQATAAKQYVKPHYQAKLDTASQLSKAGNTDGAAQSIVSALRQTGRSDMHKADDQATQLLNPNFTLNLPPSLLAGILQYGPDSHKKAATAALTTADRTLANQGNAKQAVEEIVKTGVDTKNTALITPIARNINLAANISETHVGRIVAMGDDKLTTQVLKSRKTAQDRKDKESKEGKE